MSQHGEGALDVSRHLNHVSVHCKNRIIIYDISLSFWLQMSEPITHIDTDNCMTIHRKGTSYFDSTAHLFTPLKEISYHSL